MVNLNVDSACVLHCYWFLYGEEVPDGVVELIQRVFGSEDFSGNQYVNAASDPQRAETGSIVFSGRNKVEAKRALLRYWQRNRSEIDVTFDELQRRCRLLEDGKTIVYDKRS